MTEKFGFRYTCDSVALAMLIFSILYFMLAKGPSAFERRQYLKPKESKMAQFEMEAKITESLNQA